jgi:sugar O-acyltransferase (sialic acid O-acetyltransferase NeuD family)
MTKVVIFGIEDFAQLAHFYLTSDTDHDVVAFTVNREFLTHPDFIGLPVVAFEDLIQIYPPEDYFLFAPMSPTKMNKVRANIYTQAKNMGYRMISYISSKATYYGTPVGENCFIFENNVIQPFTKIGNNVILWSGNHLGHHSVINDHVMVTSHVVISGHVEIGAYSFFGVNATLRDGVKIEEGTFVAIGSVIIQSTDAWCAYKGNPAEKLKIPSLRIRM